MDTQFLGPWFIKEMEVWGRDVLDLLGPANITFEKDGFGRFQFISVVGFPDCRYSVREEKPFVKFSWQGHDDSDESCGRGWACIDDDGKLRGRIFIHCGEDSAFVATRN